MVKVRLEGISKNYGDNIGVKDLNLLIDDGEYVAILGPTGAGKTTTMYLIAGLVTPSEGKIFFDDEDVTFLPAEDREVGFVFEEYNLFPRMTVEDNILFGPVVKNLDLKTSRKIEKELMALLNIQGKENNFPSEISGGQKQRVALARAIVSNTKLLVMDDPLRALDAKIREVLQIELRKLVKDLGLTCIHATHDTHEAMRVADRIIIFKDGQIVQSGSPEEVYNHPSSIYVADFLGENVKIKGKILREKEQSFLLVKDTSTKLKINSELKEETEVVALIPLELIDVFPLEQKDSLNYDNIVEATLIDYELVGEFYLLTIKVFNQTIKGHELIGKNIDTLKKGSKVLLCSDSDDFRIFTLPE